MRYHLSLNVKDLDASVEFFGKVFAATPQKRAEGYAKFDLQAPPINLSLISGEGLAPTRVSHMGVEVADNGALEDWRRRLAEQGILTREEKDSTCCYARQDKLWFADPDGNPWEIFTVHEQLPVPEGARGCNPDAGTDEGAEAASPDQQPCCG